VNGTGKTTTIGKLALRFKNQGLSVLLACADTFRAASTEQLQIWAKTRRRGTRLPSARRKSSNIY
jgi:fused signal recognition particle receptor